MGGKTREVEKYCHGPHKLSQYFLAN